MARKSMIEKEKKRKQMIQVHWEKRKQFKKIVRDLNVSEEKRLEAMIKLNNLPKNSSPIRQRNRCKITGRSRGYLRKFQISRLCFREMANNGMIPGVVKASW